MNVSAPIVPLQTVSCVTRPNGIPAILALADGTVLHGVSIGAEGMSQGEVVFNTALTGYQEVLTDPSYAKQIITFTHPHIGNVGINLEDVESRQIYAAAIVVRDVPLRFSNWRAQQSLQDFLKEQKIVGIAGVDTRRLTRILREKGAQNGCVMAGANIDPAAAIAQAREFAGLNGMDVAKEVSLKQNAPWRQSQWKLGAGYGEQNSPRFKVVAYDFGVKSNILRMLAERGCDLTIVPAQTPAEVVLAMQPNGIFLSNGPGDPEPCDYAIAAITKFLEYKIPLFGICLGHQLMGLAGGARTVKMKFGHRGANHPVKDLRTGQVLITSQNHGFAVDTDTLPSNIEATHVSLFDGTLQGMRWTDRPAFCFQGHPEASPGPHDCAYLFDDFIAAMAHAR